MINKEMSKILEAIIFDSSYNEQTGEYHLSKEVYTSLHLSDSKSKSINELCEHLGIKIQYPNKKLPDIKGVEFFQEYNNIRKKLIEDPNLKDIRILEERRIELRNIIVTLNIELVDTVINRRINGNFNMYGLDNLDKEDIKQLGYEALLKYIDNNYLDPKKLKEFLSQNLILHIRNISSKNNGTKINNENTIILKKIKEILSREKGNVSLTYLSQKLGVKEKRIEDLLNLLNIQNPINLDEQGDIPSQTNNSIEEVYMRIIKEQIMKLIDTLSFETQKQALIMKFGLNGEKEHTLEEIAQKTNISTETVRLTIVKALEKLKHQMRIKYLSKISEYSVPEYTSYSIYDALEEPLQKNRELRNLEKFLLLQMNKDVLLKIINTFDSRSKRALLDYLGYKDDEKEKEGPRIYKEDRENGLILLRKKLTEMYISDVQNGVIEDYFDYLMHNYLNKTRKINRKR